MSSVDRGLRRYAHITQEQADKVSTHCYEAESWLNDKMNAQKKVALFQDPVVTAHEIDAKMVALHVQCRPIFSTPNPAPPKNKKLAPSTPAAERNIVVLRDWSFAKIVVKSRGGLGFRLFGTHSSLDRDWFSTEILEIISDGVVQTVNKSLYRLEGPANPARHNAQNTLNGKIPNLTILNHFCKSTWPSDAKSLLEQVSKIFSGDKDCPSDERNDDGDEDNNDAEKV